MSAYLIKFYAQHATCPPSVLHLRLAVLSAKAPSLSPEIKVGNYLPRVVHKRALWADTLVLCISGQGHHWAPHNMCHCESCLLFSLSNRPDKYPTLKVILFFPSYLPWMSRLDTGSSRVFSSCYSSEGAPLVLHPVLAPGFHRWSTYQLSWKSSPHRCSTPLMWA